MSRIKLLFCLLFVLLSSLGFSQNDKKEAISLLKKVSDLYSKKEALSFNTKYVIYYDYSSQRILEQYNGFILKNKQTTYFRLKNTEFVSFENIGLKINNDDKEILINKVDKKLEMTSPFSLDAYLKNFSAKLLSGDNENFVCELKPAKISQEMYSKVIIYIKKSDYSIVKQQMYYVQSMGVKNDKGKTIQTIPRLEITTTPRVGNKNIDENLLVKGNYFTENNTQIVLSKRLQKYKRFN